MTTLTDLITRFRTQIRDNGTTQALTDPEATQFIQDGLLTYSMYRPRKRSVTLQIVAGQSTYALPSDWMEQDYESFSEATHPPRLDPYETSPFEFIAVTQITAPPMGATLNVSYDFYPSDLQMVITPTPATSYTLTFDYNACHTADDTSVSVPQRDLSNALLPGAVLALQSIATDYSVKLQKYKVGNSIQVDDSAIAENLKDRSDELNAKFERDIIKRPMGGMG